VVDQGLCAVAVGFEHGIDLRDRYM
jgi:hypothetical protein